MTLETIVCPNCGHSLNESDGYCHQCGNSRNTFKLDLMPKFKLILIFSFSFLIGVIYPLENRFQNLIFFSHNSYQIFQSVGITFNFLLDSISLMKLGYYLLILFIVYVFCKIINFSLNKNNYKKFLLIEFFITGFGFQLTYLVSGRNDYFQRVHLGIFPVSYLHLFLIRILIDLVVKFLIGGFTITAIFIFGLLFQTLSVDTNKYVNYPRVKIFLFGVILGIAMTVLLLLFDEINLDSIDLFGNLMTPAIFIILRDQFIIPDFLSLVLLVIEIAIIYIFITSYSIYPEKKTIFQDSFASYLAIAIGSFFGWFIYNILYGFIFTQTIDLTLLVNLPFIIGDIFSGFNLALMPCVLLISMMLLNSKGLLLKESRD